MASCKDCIHKGVCWLQQEILDEREQEEEQECCEADVVPRSEYSEVVNEYEQFIIDQINTKQEVAREIFEEIEKVHDDCIVIGTNDVGYLQVCKFEQKLAELKKKYIGE